MQSEVVNIFLEFLFASIASCIIYFVGFFLLPYFPIGKWNEKSVYTKPYFIMVLGLVVMVLLYSLIMAKGKTIHFLLLPVLVSLFFLPREKHDGELLEQNLWRTLLWLVAGSISFVVLFHLLPESEYKQMDAVHYFDISRSLDISGQENAFGSLSLFGNAYVGVEPYHYFEFWWNAILLKLFGDFLPGVIVLRFVCFGTISSIALFGLFALAEKLVGKPLTFWQTFFCVAFVFYWPRMLTFFEFLRPVFTYGFENNLIERPNLRTLYLFMPGLLIVLREKNGIRQILFWVIGTMVASVAFFAVIPPAIILLCLAFFFLKGHIDKSRFSPLIICVVVASVVYLLFYYLFHTRLQATTEGVTINNLVKYVVRYWKIISLTSVTSVFNCLFIPVLFFLFLNKKFGAKLSAFFEVRHLIVFLCAVVLFGVLMARFFNFVDNSYQFAFTSYAASGFIFFVLVFGSASLFKISEMLYTFVGCAILVFFLLLRFVFPAESYASVFKINGNYAYNTKKFSKVYLDSLLSVFPPGAKITGAYWADALYYDTVPYFSNRNPNVYSLASSYILAGKLNYNFEVCLSDSASIMYGIDTTQKVVYNYLASAILRSAFHQYNLQTGLNAKRLSLIKKYRLEYLMLTKNADTSIISQLPVSKYFQDGNTGERFYLLGTK